MKIQWNSNAMVFSATVVGAVLMNSVFQFYYVKLFLTHYRISPYWFNFAQVSYMIWNAINDPLFGYFQDYSNLNCLKHRRLNILYGAPLFSLSFLLPWFAWGDGDSPTWIVGLHLLISLCCYDCMFTFVLLAHCSLFAETSRKENERQSNLMHSQIATLLGSSSVFLCELISHQMNDMKAFQITCVFIAIVSCFLMRYTGHNITVAVDRTEQDEASEDNEGWRRGLSTSMQIMTNRNFVAFVLTNFLQIFHQSFCANFFSIFREELIGSNGTLPSFLKSLLAGSAFMLPPFLKSLLAGSAFMLPPVAVLLLDPVLKKYGSYTLIKYLFAIKIMFGIALYSFGYGSVLLIAIFMVCDSTLVGTSFSYFNLSLSHIIDHDQAKYSRKHPVSSMVFGLNALITKPAQSISPMLIVYILRLYGYQANKDMSKAKSNPDLQIAMFSIMVAIPVILGILQLLLWRMFSLTNSGGQLNSSKMEETM